MNQFQIFSFFSGCGFLDFGFEEAGFPIVLANEIRPSFADAYRFSHEQMGRLLPEYGIVCSDIHSFFQRDRNMLSDYMSAAAHHGDITGFIGGPPCPDFSVAGKNREMNGENGKLSLSYINLITDMKPDFFLFENVKGLWKTARHRKFFDELKKKTEDAGYMTSVSLLNAMEFGVPQDRERILMFGILKEKAPRDIASFSFDRHKKYRIKDIRNCRWLECTSFSENSSMPYPDGIIKELTIQHWFDKNQVLEHPNAEDFFRPKSGLSKMLEIPEGDTSRKSYKRLHRFRYSPTAAYGNNEVHLHPYKARRLSVSEVLAIQSMPPGFCFPKNMTLTDKFKTVGNGVPFLLANGIAESIKDFFKDI